MYKKEIDVRDLDKKKEKLEKGYSKTKINFQGAQGERLEEEFKQYTIGLSTREDFKKKQDNIDQLVQERDDKELEEEQLKKKREIIRKKKQYNKQIKQLSFGEDEEENSGEEEGDLESILANDKKRKNPEKNKEDSNIGDKVIKKQAMGKNPNINTSFLPDKERDRQKDQSKKQFEIEYKARKDKLENQYLDVKYSYWDGFKVIKEIRIKQKTSMNDFLDKCRKNLIQEYPHLAKLKAEELIGVTKDHIIPSKKTFYELIESKAKNKEDELLFNFTEKTIKNPIGQDAIVGQDENCVIMILERKITEKPGENPLYFFLKK